MQQTSTLQTRSTLSSAGSGSFELKGRRWGWTTAPNVDPHHARAKFRTTITDGRGCTYCYLHSDTIDVKAELELQFIAWSQGCQKT